MLGWRTKIGATLAAVAIATTSAVAPAGAGAAGSGDVAATHAYLVAGYALLNDTVSRWSVVEAALNKLDARFKAECPHVGEGSPQSEEEQHFAMAVAGALWATGYAAKAKAVRAFVKTVGRLRWSRPAINHSAKALTKGLSEMLALGVPDLCGDVKAWAAGGYGAVPASVKQYAHKTEAIEIKQIPRGLLAPYVQGSDRALEARDRRLYARFEELEFVRGQAQWNGLLEVLSLNQ